MKNKLIKINMWYNKLLHTSWSTRFLIFLLGMTIMFSLPRSLQILLLVTLIVLRIVTVYAQNYVKKEKVKAYDFS
jgi:hypothetical protein